MQRGTCRLCGKFGDLVDGHIWPSFGYKRYVADQSKGGRFVDLALLDLSNRHHSRYWFCPKCDNERLSGLERYAGKFCAALERDKNATQTYGANLLPFVTSISLRAAMYDVECRNLPTGDRLFEALSRWKKFLLGKRNDVMPYSQHLFVVFGKGVDWHKTMGGEVFPNEQVILSQFGPLFIVSLLSRGGRSLAELREWDKSEVRPDGGEVRPITDWNIGQAISPPFDRVLRKHCRQMMLRAVSTNKNL
jgi:hypothetical protein